MPNAIPLTPALRELLSSDPTPNRTLARNPLHNHDRNLNLPVLNPISEPHPWFSAALLKIKSHKPQQGRHKPKQGNTRLYKVIQATKKNRFTSLVYKVTYLPPRP